MKTKIDCCCRMIRVASLFGAVTGISMFAVGLPARYWSGGIYSGIAVTSLAVVMAVVFTVFIRCEGGEARKSRVSQYVVDHYQRLKGHRHGAAE